MRRLLTSLVVAVAVLGGGACARPEPTSGEATLRVHASSLVRVGRSDGPARAVAGERTLPRGSLVSVESGGATLVLSGGAALELREGSKLVVDHRPELRGGDALALSGDRPLTVEAAATSLTVVGAAKLSRSLAVSVQAFQGSVAVSSAGRGLTVPALRQATVPAFGLVPSRPAPLSYDVEDTWDRRFLGLAMDLTDALQSYSDGITALPRAPGGGIAPDELGELLPQLPASSALGDVLAARRTPGETLVGAAVVASGRWASVDERWQAVFGFRDEGAAWGLVVLDYASDPSSVLALVGDASRRSYALSIFATSVLAPPVDPAGAATAPSPDTGPATDPAPPTTPPATTAPGLTLPSLPGTVTTGPDPLVALPPVELPAVTLPPVTVPPLDPVAEAVVGLVTDLAGTVPSLLP